MKNITEYRRDLRIAMICRTHDIISSLDYLFAQFIVNLHFQVMFLSDNLLQEPLKLIVRDTEHNSFFNSCLLVHIFLYS